MAAGAPGLQELELQRCWLANSFTLTPIGQLSALKTLMLDPVVQPVKLSHLNHILRGLPLLESLRLDIKAYTAWAHNEEIEDAVPWPTAIHRCTRLTHVEISGMRAQGGRRSVDFGGVLPLGISVLQRLQTMSLRGCNAWQVRGVESLVALTRLELLERLASPIQLPLELSALSALREVALSCARVPEALSTLRRLAALTLHRLEPVGAVGIIGLAQAAAGLTRLRLSACSEVAVAALELLPLPALRVLVLDGNGLRAWPQLHADLAGHLQALSLSNNDIEDCDLGRLAALQSVEMLDLSHNRDMARIIGAPPRFFIEAVASLPLLGHLNMMSGGDLPATFTGSLLIMQEICSNIRGRVPLTVHVLPDSMPPCCEDCLDWGCEENLLLDDA